ncbi:unnamed protein product [Pseudo-nitzschia multistriata]|uniref:Uncharacterized protein n=1 Tax=Pseudo-nitzschia multistriata TaxID=183589 RepID=A0A448Z0V8_9STRA|nr:unnamed protein product [Pseudo-nitzschia multistriata]
MTVDNSHAATATADDPLARMMSKNNRQQSASNDEVDAMVPSKMNNDAVGNKGGFHNKENNENQSAFVLNGPETSASAAKINSTISQTDRTHTASIVDAPPILARPRATLDREISRQVLRHKLQKLRHLVLEGVVSEEYLEQHIMHPKLLDMFDPQTVTYNGGIAKIKEWKISCYLEVMEGGVPCTNPHTELLEVFRPLLNTCDDLFLAWYKQQHACNNHRTNRGHSARRTCERLMTFVTRYTPAPGEQALLKHVDGAGKVDGSCVLALPVDRWTGPDNSFYGHGGGLTFWDGREPVPEDDGGDRPDRSDGHPKRTRPRTRPREIHYDTRPGDIAFIDRAVWHQADPITKGTRWALVIFYKVTEQEDDENDCEQERK